MKKTLRISLILAMLISFASASPVAAEDTCTSSGIPAVSTDQDDYDPFGTVTIYGSGFACGEALSILVTAPDGSALSGDGAGTPGPDNLTTDQNGEFVLSYQLYGTLPDGSPYTGQEGQYTIQVLDSSGINLAEARFSDSLGGWHTCALTESGDVKCWGFNSQGQLGNNSTSDSSIPADVVGLTSQVAQITAGSNHTCALTTDGGVKCWGLNNYGQLGDGTRTNRLSPVGVVGLDSGVVQISANGYHTCALMSAGGLKCWGNNSAGQLGDDSYTSYQLTPVAVSGLDSGVVQVSAGFRQTCALTTGGSLKCWGANSSGQLGDGTRTSRRKPVDVVGLDSVAVQVSSGGFHTCALIEDGGVKCWGSNGVGQFGNGSNTNSWVPVDSFATNMREISSGYQHTCALTSSRGAQCWGWNAYGQIGDGTTTYPLTPADVSGLDSDVGQISTGGFHTCALVESLGAVKCWGRNDRGQLGDGTTTQKLTPVNVSGLASGVAQLPDYYNRPPSANPGGPYLEALYTEVHLDGGASSDPEGHALTFAWDFGDGATATGQTPTHTYVNSGVYDVCLTVNDGQHDSEPGCTLAVIYDPDGGFVTGGGRYFSTVGAYKLYPNTWDYANFGFFSKYIKGSDAPTGQTEFQLQTATFNFHSTSYQWLVVNQAGTNAQFKGEGTINGELAPNGALYKFMIWAGDMDPATDTFRIKIWYEAGEEIVVYDNGFDQPIGGGSIQIHAH